MPLFDAAPGHEKAVEMWRAGQSAKSACCGSERQSDEPRACPAPNDHDVQPGAAALDAPTQLREFELSLANSDKDQRRFVGSLCGVTLEPDPKGMDARKRPHHRHGRRTPVPESRLESFANSNEVRIHADGAGVQEKPAVHPSDVHGLHAAR